MEIHIESKRKRPENIMRQYPGSVIIDVTSNAPDEFVKFSPFYPIGDIPVPGMPGEKALCVEGIWQGLKVFETTDYDKSYFQKSNKDIKRTVKKFGKVRGHYFEGKLLNYLYARKLIYVPAYRFVLENSQDHLVQKMRDITSHKTLVLLDYSTNDSILIPKPLSHAAIIRAAILNDFSLLEQTNSPKYTPIQGSLF